MSNIRKGCHLPGNIDNDKPLLPQPGSSPKALGKRIHNNSGQLDGQPKACASFQALVHALHETNNQEQPKLAPGMQIPGRLSLNANNEH